jgi:hypothetical protein
LCGANAGAGPTNNPTYSCLKNFLMPIKNYTTTRRLWCISFKEV